MSKPLQTYGLQGTKPVEKARNSLVRMERLELSRVLHPLEPKSSASANSATSAREETNQS